MPSSVPSPSSALAHLLELARACRPGSSRRSAGSAPRPALLHDRLERRDHRLERRRPSGGVTWKLTARSRLHARDLLRASFTQRDARAIEPSGTRDRELVAIGTSSSPRDVALADRRRVEMILRSIDSPPTRYSSMIAPSPLAATARPMSRRRQAELAQPHEIRAHLDLRPASEKLAGSGCTEPHP